MKQFFFFEHLVLKESCLKCRRKKLTDEYVNSVKSFSNGMKDFFAAFVYLHL